MNRTHIGRLLLTLSLIGMSWCMKAPAGSFTVTTTRDSVAGSFRQAIESANSTSGADTILFNIPMSDPGYSAGVWTLRPQTPFPQFLDHGTIADATSQTSNRGDTNPEGPEIELDGSLAGDNSCFGITGRGIVIKGFVINRFAGVAIDAYGSTARDVTIVGNYIGTDATGMSRQGNGNGGIWIRLGANNAKIGGPTAAERNVIAGTANSVNLATGNGIYIAQADSARIQGNHIGVNKLAGDTIPNVRIGVCVRESKFTLVGGTNSGEGNVIGGSGWVGILFRMPTASGNTVAGNYIGTNADGRVNLGNLSYGIRFDFGAQRNTIGPSNTIKFSGSHGIVVDQDSTTRNTITRNRISGNTGSGITLSKNGNAGISPPVITSVTPSAVSGTALPRSVVEIYSDSADEGAILEGVVTAGPGGAFMWNGTARGPNVTATCTDTAGNTSAFSAPLTGIGPDVNEAAQSQFALAQNYPNPFNGTTKIVYAVPAAHDQGSGTVDVELVVYDVLGRRVAVLVNGRQPTGVHEVTFDAGGLPSGAYVYRLRAGNLVQSRRLIIER